MGNFWADFQGGEGQERILTLPYPPSVNHLWRHVVIKGAVRTLLSAEGRKYRVAAREGITGEPLTGRLAVRVIVYPPDRRKRDLDNVLKSLDALSQEINKKTGKVVFPGVWLDDSQIDILHVERGPVHREGGYVRVHVREIAGV